MTTKCEKFYNNIDKITGLSSNSASLSDIWFIRFKNAFHGSHEAVLKLYASEIQFPGKEEPGKDFENYIYNNKSFIEKHIESLNYEGDVYEYLCGFLNYGAGSCKTLNPNFSTFYAHSEEYTYDELLNLLSKGMEVDEKKFPTISKLVKEQLNKNLQRNLLFTIIPDKNLLGNNNRPAIDTIKDLSFPSKINYDIIKSAKYRFTMTKAFSKVKGEHTTFNKFLSNKKNTTDNILIPVITQILSALNIMEVLGVVHNDFHPYNLYIRTLSEDETYRVKNYSYELKEGSYGVIIFDFDRAYAETFGDNSLLENYDNVDNVDNDPSFCYTQLQCNEFGKERFTKTYCLVISYGTKRSSNLFIKPHTC